MIQEQFAMQGVKTCVVNMSYTRGDIHARIQEFSSGGGGGPGQSDKKISDVVFFTFYLFSPQLILQKSNGHFQRNLSFFKVPEGVQHFPGGPTFSRGGGGGGGGRGPIAYSL